MKKIMKGNDALAEAAILAGCRFFAGYPITPQTEILEALAKRLPEAGGHFVQTESELAGINMVLGAAAAGFRAMTSSSGPGFSLKQEGISYMSSMELPAVIVDVMRYGIGLGNIVLGQGDYFQAVKGGGHGGYRLPVYAPSSVQENADIIVLAFDTADKYRTPVIVLSDGAIGQMAEAVEMPKAREHDPYQWEWALNGRDEKHPLGRKMTDRNYYDFAYNEYDPHLRSRYKEMEDNLQFWEEVSIEDAEIILVSYGISARVCKEAVALGRAGGIRLGLIRPISLWPFPKKAFLKADPRVKGYLTVEMNACGQMVEDVALSVRNAPIYSYPSGRVIADSDVILKKVEEILFGSEQEVY
jgi:2-oxoglutarate ferredoxin oxidoreductase subunit alpha